MPSSPCRSRADTCYEDTYHADTRERTFLEVFQTIVSGVNFLLRSKGRRGSMRHVALKNGQRLACRVLVKVPHCPGSRNCQRSGCGLGLRFVSKWRDQHSFSRLGADVSTFECDVKLNSTWDALLSGRFGICREIPASVVGVSSAACASDFGNLAKNPWLSPERPKKLLPPVLPHKRFHRERIEQIRHREGQLSSGRNELIA